MYRDRTSIWIRLATWVGCESAKDAVALVAAGIIIGWLLAQGV